MDLKRVISAVLGLPLVILVILLGNKYVIDIVLAIVAVISLHEYYNAFNKYKPVKWIGYLYATMIGFIHIIPSDQLFNYIALSMPVVVVILFIQLVIKDLEINIIDIAITVFGIMYIVLFILFIPLLANVENGKVLIWFAIIPAWGTDVFAYIIGKTFKLGKHKFSKISPNKSIEGCIAGVIGAILLSMIYVLFLDKVLNIQMISYMKTLMIAPVLSIIGQFGDFAASSIKRFVGIKDYGNLIPGHGGLLDRIDSLIFIAPFAYILLTII